MGRTPKPLSILVHPEIDGDAFDALREKGHDVYTMDSVLAFDLVVGPTCWRMTPELLPMLETALKAARSARYGRGKHETNT